MSHNCEGLFRQNENLQTEPQDYTQSQRTDANRHEFVPDIKKPAMQCRVHRHIDTVQQ